MSEEGSIDLSCETRHRRRAVPGGTTVCAWCDQQRVAGSSFCLEHKRAYQRQWSRQRTNEFKRLQKMFAVTSPQS